MMANIFYKEGNTKYPTILMLHGTGGNETDLVQVADIISPESPKLGIRGRHIEGGMTRYFLHDENGGFDKESLDTETDWLMEEAVNQLKERNLDPENTVILGFSNGANVAAYGWQKGNNPFKAGILMHPMSLFNIDNAVDNENIKVWISYGHGDFIVSEDNFEMLKENLTEAGCDISIFNHSYGHQLTQEELGAAKDWFNRNILKGEE